MLRVSLVLLAAVGVLAIVSAARAQEAPIPTPEPTVIVVEPTMAPTAPPEPSPTIQPTTGPTALPTPLTGPTEPPQRMLYRISTQAISQCSIAGDPNFMGFTFTSDTLGNLVSVTVYQSDGTQTECGFDTVVLEAVPQ